MSFKLRVGIPTFDQKMSFLRTHTTKIPKNEVGRSKFLKITFFGPKSPNFSFFDSKCPKIPFSDLLIVIRKWGFSDQISVLKFTEIYKFNGYRP